MLKLNLDLSNYDKKLWKLISQEIIRQEENIELIASENYASSYVMQLQGSQLTNKYAEGYPGNRYYEGCKYFDSIEKLAINRAKTLFNADYANVQPHSGSQANFAVYLAFLNFGDTILSMNLSDGGHLTHGSSVNFSGKLYNFIFYGLDNNGKINYYDIEKKAITYKVKMIVGGFSSYSGIVDWEKIRKIADNIGAYFFVDMSHIAGLVASGLYPTPLPYAHVVTTTTHKTLAGPRGGMILSNLKNIKLYKKIDNSVFPGIQGGPLMHIIAAKAIALKEAMEPEFKLYQKKVIKNAKIMVKIFLLRKFNIISNNTNNHMFLLDLRNKNITGKKASEIISTANIIVNKNTIPGDLKGYNITSGIRLGTPSITRRGFTEIDIKNISHLICDILDNINNKSLILNIKNQVLKLCKKYPVYVK